MSNSIQMTPAIIRNTGLNSSRDAYGYASIDADVLDNLDAIIMNDGKEVLPIVQHKVVRYDGQPSTEFRKYYRITPKTTLTIGKTVMKVVTIKDKKIYLI